MLKKRWLIVFLLFALIVSFTIPSYDVKAETEWQKLDRQLQEIQKQQKEAAARAKQTEKQIKQVQDEHKNLEQEVATLKSEISDIERDIFVLEKQIEEVTVEAKAAAEELEKAETRVEERDELLKTRVRLMYRNGSVDYLEVLLGSSDFADFLQRFNALQKIVDSDKRILEDNINDKNTIEQKKQEIDKALANLESLYAENEQLKITLETKMSKTKVMIASLEQKEAELEDILEAEDQKLIELANEYTKINNELSKLKYSGVMAWPVPSSDRVTSEYGMRADPFTGKTTGHKGIDIGRAPGTDSLYGADIVAAADGIVIVAQYVSGYGNTVMIDHGSGITTVYGHIRNGGTFVKVGQRVEKGQKIAEVGSTGRSTGPHLHFEVRENNVPVNPWKYLK